jgi:uncharacterized RDD family membrane protein YckC
VTNPYAPPQSMVLDVSEPGDTLVRAERGTRLGAAILDTFIFGCLVYVPLFGGIFIGALMTGGESEGGLVASVVGLGSAAVGFIVWLALTFKFLRENGQSIGKRMLNIKVVRSDGSPISLARIVWLRNVVNVVLSFVPLYGIIDSLFIFGEAQQCLHDKLADTIVVKA